MSRDNKRADEWLTAIILRLAETEGEKKPIPRGRIISPNGTLYTIYNPLRKTSSYNLHTVQLPSGPFGMIKISSEPGFNMSLVNEAALLRNMREKALSIDTDLRQYNYQYFFPEVMESFVSPDNRYVLVLGYADVIKELKQLSSISKIMTPDPNLPDNRYRVDLKTIVWVLGKMLKVVGFAHDNNIHVSLIDERNVLIEPNLHGIVFFDWSVASVFPDKVPVDLIFHDIKKAIELAFIFAGGNLKTGSLPRDETILSAQNHKLFESFFNGLFEVETLDALSIHSKLYELADQIWPKQLDNGILHRQFHEFCVYPLK